MDKVYGLFFLGLALMESFFLGMVIGALSDKTDYARCACRGRSRENGRDQSKLRACSAPDSN